MRLSRAGAWLSFRIGNILCVSFLQAQGQIELPSRLIAHDVRGAAWAADCITKRGMKELAFDFPRTLKWLYEHPDFADPRWRWVVQVMLDRFILLGGRGADQVLLPWVASRTFDASLLVLAARAPEKCRATLLALASPSRRVDVFKAASAFLCATAPRELASKLLSELRLPLFVRVTDGRPRGQVFG